MGAHMNRRFSTVAILAVLTARVLGCGGGSGNGYGSGSGEVASNTDVQNVANPPMLEDFVMTTSPVVIGEQAYGTVYAEDLDGLTGLVLRLEFDGPATGTSEAPLADPGTAVGADVPIDFVLLPGWPTGEYTITLTAIDTQGFESDPVSTTVLVDASPGDLGTLAL